MMTINPPTAALLLSEFVTLGQGDWVVQNAANSAVGLYLVQLARHRGHRTVNVVRREDAATVVREAGSDVVLVNGEDLAKRVTEVTDGAEVRLGIDTVAGTATGRLAGCLCIGVWGEVPADPMVQPHIERGAAGWVLVSIACRPGDLLVVGARRRGALARMVSCRVSRYCVAHAQCPVLTVPPTALAQEIGHGRLAWAFRHRTLTPARVLRDQDRPAG